LSKPLRQLRQIATKKRIPELVPGSKNSGTMNYKPAKVFDADGDLSKRWFVFFYFKNPTTGKFVRFRYFVSTRFLSVTDRGSRAKEMQKLWNTKLARGYNPFSTMDHSMTSTTMALEGFLSSKNHLRKRTVNTYRSFINRFKEWLTDNKLNHQPIAQMNYQVAGKYLDYISSLGHKSRTYNNYLQALRSAFNYLVDEQFLEVNPFDKYRQRPEEETEIICFTQSELQKISDTLPTYDYNLYVIALLVYNCFLRPQEIVRLKVRNIKESGDYLSIPGVVSKNKKSEAVAVTSAVKLALESLDLNFPDDYFVFSKDLKRGEREIAPTRIAEAWKVYAESVGLTKNIYALKHTGNGIALEMGANARDLQLQNRHSSLEETQKYLDRFRRIPSDKFRENFPGL
jgi:integrase/recombinase XerD